MLIRVIIRMQTELIYDGRFIDTRVRIYYIIYYIVLLLYEFHGEGRFRRFLQPG